MVTFKGKIGRASYAYAWLAAIAIAFLASVIVTLFQQQDSTAVGVASLVIYVTCAGLILAIVLSASVKRLRDLEWSPWLVLLQFVPFLNLLFMAALLFKPGALATTPEESTSSV